MSLATNVVFLEWAKHRGFEGISIEQVLVDLQIFDDDVVVNFKKIAIGQAPSDWCA